MSCLRYFDALAKPPVGAGIARLARPVHLQQRRLFRTHGFDAGVDNYLRSPRMGLRKACNVHMGTYTRHYHKTAAQPRWWLLGFVLTGGYILVVRNRVKIPYVGRSQFIGLPLEMDVSIGEGLYDNLEVDVLPKYHAISIKTRRVLNKLLLAMREDSEVEPQLKTCGDWQWVLCVAADSERNAYSLPGGKMVVNQGLVEALTPNQLAFILGHEMGHAIARHGTEKRLWWHIRRLLSEFVATGSGLSQILHTFAIDYPYSRQVEKEADFIGLCLATSAGYSLTESDLVEALKDIHSQEQSTQYHGGGFLDVLFDTHPSPTDRVSSLLRRQPEVLRDCLLRKSAAYAQGSGAFHATHRGPFSAYRVPAQSATVGVDPLTASINHTTRPYAWLGRGPAASTEKERADVAWSDSDDSHYELRTTLINTAAFVSVGVLTVLFTSYFGTED